MELQGKNIVLTGGTSGIGLALARRLHPGNRIAVVASHAPRLQRLESELPGVTTIQADLSRQEAVRAVAAELLDTLGHIDLLINNAAVQHEPTFLDPVFDPGSIASEIAVNFTAVSLLSALLLPGMLHAEPAAIVNVNSALGLVPKTQSAVYCATKGAVNLFSLALRNQLADTNVAVMQAFVPLVDTNMTAGRGKHKMSATAAAAAIVDGITRGVEDHDIGAVRWVRLLSRLAPGLARQIMQIS